MVITREPSLLESYKYAYSRILDLIPALKDLIDDLDDDELDRVVGLVRFNYITTFPLTTKYQIRTDQQCSFGGSLQRLQ